MTLISGFVAAGLALLCLPAAAADGYECLIEPTQSIEVRSPVVGLLEKVNVHRGDKVAQGQVIANIESSAERAAAELARYKAEMVGAIHTAENKVNFGQKKYRRRQDMQADNFMSVQDRDDAEAEYRLAESELQQAHENQQMARLEAQQQDALLNLRTIRSPFEGVVVDQQLYPGEVVEPSEQKKPILKLAQLNPLRVHVILPLAQFGQVRLGMSAQVVPEAPVGGSYTGHVKVVDRLVDAASGTFGVFIELPNPKLDIPAGLRCRASFS
jgi:RND family efflux transporter MFP subunit